MKFLAAFFSILLFPMLALPAGLTISSTNGFGQTTRLQYPGLLSGANLAKGGTIRVTNDSDVVVVIFDGMESNRFSIQFGTNGALGRIWWNGQHSGAPEMQFDGDSFAFGPGSYSTIGAVKSNRRVQFGIGADHFWTVDFQYNKLPTAVFPLGSSGPLRWTSSWWGSNNLTTVFPTIITRAITTNGDWVLDFHTNFNDTVSVSNFVDLANSPTMQLVGGNTNGLRVNGILRVSGIATLTNTVFMGSEASPSVTVTPTQLFVGNGSTADLLVWGTGGSGQRYFQAGPNGTYVGTGASGLSIGKNAAASLGTLDVVGTAFISSTLGVGGVISGNGSGLTNIGTGANMQKTASDTQNFTSLATVTNYAFSTLRGFTGSLVQGTLTNTAAGFYAISADLELTDVSGSVHTMAIYTNTVLAGRISELSTVPNAAVKLTLLPQAFFLPANCRIEMKEVVTSGPSVSRNFDRATLNVESW
jgi:hypothetical protein